MKTKLLLLAVIAFVYKTSFAQTFSDNFDSYTAGAYLGVSNSAWKTWSNSPGGADDIKISNAKAKSGSNSLYFYSVAGGPSDIVLPFSGQHNTGSLSYTMWMFINPGKKAYFNFQEQTVNGTGWSFEANFDSIGNISMSNTTGGTLLNSTYTQNQWIKVDVKVDLNSNTWELLIDGSSKGIFQNTYRQVASIDIYAMAGSSFYIDDVSYTYTPYTQTALNASLTYIDKVSGALAGQVKLPVLEIRNLGTQAITSATVELTYNGIPQTKNVTGINIASSGTYSITLDNPIIIVSGSHTLTATVTLVNNQADDNAADNSKSMVINPVIPAIGKLVIAEESTGTWCPWCPRGAVFLKNMDDKYHGLIQGIAVHNNDPMTYPVYDQGMSTHISSYPSVITDRGIAIDPQLIEGDFLARIVVAPKSMIRNGSEYNSSSGVLKVSLTTRFVAAASGNYKIACVLIEDSVTGTGSSYNQYNNYANNAHGAMGGFELLPNPVPASKMVYDHVARIISPNFLGLPNAFGTTINAGDSFTHDFSFTLDPSWKAGKISIVGMVIDPSGKIDNAAAVSINEATANGYKQGTFVSAIRKLDAPENVLAVYPNPSHDNFNLVLNNLENTSQISVYNICGQLVHNTSNFNGTEISIHAENWPAGIYIVHVENSGQSYTQKLIKE